MIFLALFGLFPIPAKCNAPPELRTSSLELLRYPHSVILAGRSDKNPGQFKSQVNRAGETVFVEPDLVLGTLHRGWELLPMFRHPMARAIYAMFLVAEVYPFSDECPYLEQKSR